MKIKIIPLIFLLMAFAVLPGRLCAKELMGKPHAATGRNLPIDVVADRLDAYHDERRVVFSGDAVARQGDKTIQADSIIVYYKKNQGSSDQIGSKKLEKTGDLDKIEARGHVAVIQGDRTVTGDNALFYNDAQKITMTGNAVMREGSNVVRGDTIVVFLNENRGIVESAENKRVTATIYPKNEEEKGKP
ncbi:MAG: hypothetical protein JW943_07940 [Deltaproteobacteria bacterium]|nr:hypothetical protein [Deltaproteobacteria bacterium]